MDTSIVTNSMDTYFKAKQGQAVTYHVGHVAKERITHSTPEMKKSYARVISEVANFFWQEHLKGRCFLTQEKLGNHKYRYIATKKLDSTIKTHMEKR